jgi:hypothetical protein
VLRLPTPRGETSEALLSALHASPGVLTAVPVAEDDPLTGEDLHLSLYLLYELHYRGLPGIDDGWEWDPALLTVRAALEARFEDALVAQIGQPSDGVDPTEMDLALRAIADADEAPSVSRHIERSASLAQLHEFLVHRSAYQLKEADPHSWALPRLWGAPKAALVAIQADEYGGGRAERIHAQLFADAMDAVGLDSRYGAYLDAIPGVTLATVNLMSMLGLHRRWRGAIVGHLAAFEMTSSLPNRLYGDGFRRLGFDEDTTWYFDEHVEADAVHEQIAGRDLAGSLAEQEPELVGDILFGAAACLHLDDLVADHVLDAWTGGTSSLRSA